MGVRCDSRGKVGYLLLGLPISEDLESAALQELGSLHIEPDRIE